MCAKQKYLFFRNNCLECPPAFPLPSVQQGFVQNSFAGQLTARSSSQIQFYYFSATTFVYFLNVNFQMLEYISAYDHQPGIKEKKISKIYIFF